MQRIKDEKTNKTKVIIDKPKTAKSIRAIPISNKLYEILLPLKRKYKDEDLDLSYYAVAQAHASQEGIYSAFTVCSENPIFFVTHPLSDDFKNSLFQSAFLKAAKTQLAFFCPKATQFTLFAFPTDKIDEHSWVLKAQINTKTQETTLQYPVDKKSFPLPQATELRREEVENLMTVQPNGAGSELISYSLALPTYTPAIQPNTKDKNTLEKNRQTSSSTTHSAIDLILLARLSQAPVQGKAVVHVDTTQLDQSASTDWPLPLVLKGVHLTPGWYIISGSFEQKPTPNVQLLFAQPCTTEGCLHEK